MVKLQYAIYKKDTGNAGGKAKNDVFDILLKQNFLPTYKPSQHRPIRILQQILSMMKIRKDTLLIVQYPAVEARLMRLLSRRIAQTNCFSVAVIHDLPSIQGVGGDSTREINELNHFDCVIVHNLTMEKYLLERGYTGKTVVLHLFDYLHDATRSVMEGPYSNTIAIAGNLDKARYITDLGKIEKVKFNLYGINHTLDLSVLPNATYKGCLPSDEIQYLLEADYGLVWDGDSIDECSGVYGKYLLYNNPHKLSLYIAAGKPVIVWKKAAVAEFVVKNGIGIAVDSLQELDTLDLEADYQKMQRNVLRLKDQIADGYYLKSAVEEILKIINI